MGFLRYATILGGIALLIHYFMDMLYSKHPFHFEGEVHDEYKEIRGAFHQNFIDGWEAEGASVAVYVQGEKVVDQWGGYADIQAVRTWKKDTITVVFSVTKAVAAVCIALLADRGQLKYDDLVSKHWPGFAKNGKENITIEWVMSHMAGLPYFDTIITEKIANDHNLMREVIENESPKLPPGGRSEYHAFTYGWLVDQIIRHTDQRKRGIGQFLREEITQPYGIDFHIGLSATQEYRVARVSLPSLSALIREMWYDWKIAQAFYQISTSGDNSMIKKIFNNVPWLDFLTKCTVNNPDQHAMEQAGALGIGNARSLAAIFNLFLNGGIVSEKTLSFLKKPVKNETDSMSIMELAKGHGFLYAFLDGNDSEPMMLHPGYGCQQVTVDLKNNVVIAYVTNGLKNGVLDHCRSYMRLHKAVYDVIRRLQSKRQTSQT